MELMRLVLSLIFAGEALTRPVRETRDLSQDRDDSDSYPTVFEIIEATNNNQAIPVLLEEGDIAVNLYRNARICNSCLWKKNKNGTVPVPYVIDPKYSPSDQFLITEALKEFEVMTCVQFVNRSSESNYLYIQSGSGCWSSIGKNSGKQIVSLQSPSCMVYGVVQHEAMHNIGFFHENTRVDRDKYIDILWDNIDPVSLSKFNITVGNIMNLSYDYTSVMHFHMYAYTKKANSPTIVPKPDPKAPIGQRIGMSNLDVMKINALYKCNLCREKLMAASGSFSGNSSFANQFGGNCLWLIQVPKGKICLQVFYLNVSSTDYIQVYDGVTKSSPILLETTNVTGPIPPLFSSRRNILVEFVSSDSSEYSRFKASFASVV